jgi:hypothetical protein
MWLEGCRAWRDDVDALAIVVVVVTSGAVVAAEKNEATGK